MGELSAADRDRLRSAIMERGDTHARLAFQWVQELQRTSVQLSMRGKEAGVDVMTAFWIKLYGVLDEVGGHYEYAVKLADDCGAGATRMATDARAVRDALRSVRDSMNEDELIWLSYRRDVECHVWQDSYELNRKGDRLKERRGFSLLDGKVLTVDEFDQRARAFLRKHHVDEQAIAVYFAKLVAPHVDRVIAAMAPLYETDK